MWDTRALPAGVGIALKMLAIFSWDSLSRNTCAANCGVSLYPVKLFLSPSISNKFINITEPTFGTRLKINIWLSASRVLLKSKALNDPS